jgi:hypothetical protein
MRRALVPSGCDPSLFATRKFEFGIMVMGVVSGVVVVVATVLNAGGIVAVIVGAIQDVERLAQDLGAQPLGYVELARDAQIDPVVVVAVDRIASDGGQEVARRTFVPSAWN